MPPGKPVPQQTNGWAFGGALVLIVLVISSLGKCNNRSTAPNANTTTSSFSTNMSNGVAAQPRQPPSPLSAESVTRGSAHVRLAMRDEGALGAQIYSQNCYDALSRTFSWEKLDACGAFDATAIAMIGDPNAAGLTQADWFDSEVAAGRYLAAATGAGLEAAQADERLGKLQARASRAAPAPRPVRQVEETPTEAPPAPLSDDPDTGDGPAESAGILEPVDE